MTGMISEHAIACLLAYGLYLNRPKTICAWCKKTLWPGLPSSAVGISHGICPECEKQHFGVVGPVPSPGGKSPMEAMADDFLSDLLDQIGQEPPIDV